MLPAQALGILAACLVLLSGLTAALAFALWSGPRKAAPPGSRPAQAPLSWGALLRDGALLSASLGVAILGIAALWGALSLLRWAWTGAPGWVVLGALVAAGGTYAMRERRRKRAREAAEQAARQEAEARQKREAAEAGARRAEEARQARARFEEEQRRRGLVPHAGRDGATRWVAPAEAESLARRAAASEEEAMVRACLDAFSPSMRHDHELPYHMELLGYLRARLPAALPEVQVGSSRPDIVVGRIAIEVKGPTDVAALQTVADKCVRYAQHFDVVIVVLFDVTVGERMYAEWERGIARTFPQVALVRKAPTRGPASFGSYSSRVR